jgi:hypothetical protein
LILVLFEAGENSPTALRYVRAELLHVGRTGFARVGLGKKQPLAE